MKQQAERVAGMFSPNPPGFHAVALAASFDFTFVLKYPLSPARPVIRADRAGFAVPASMPAVLPYGCRKETAIRAVEFQYGYFAKESVSASLFNAPVFAREISVISEEALSQALKPD